jgi:hypothetical protein
MQCACPRFTLAQVLLRPVLRNLTEENTQGPSHTHTHTMSKYSKFWPKGGLPGILHHYVSALLMFMS